MLTSVLVIDDEATQTETIRLILEPKDFEVWSAHGTNAGLEAVRRLNPDVVVLDLYTPGPDDWRVCRSIREFSQVPILVLSALNKPGWVAEALDRGADSFLAKPVPGGVLAAHLKNLARRARAERRAGAVG
ncbi:MAG TPA: response regulator [Anaerolineales bacterium]|nr:response regulator [Anaerolineales bacterium]